ncbi:MAG: hypothetical protein KKC20_01005 [Proteobacteria bacterium]|nr:hypothetical protein [Pseudomonadota bacterium]
MNKATLLQRGMAVDGAFSSAVLERRTGLSQSFVFKKVKEYEKAGLLKRAGLGSKKEKLWRLTLEGKRQFDPNAFNKIITHAPAEKINRMKLHPGKHNLSYQDLANQPEASLWKAITGLKQFLANDLVKMEITSKTGVYQYLALLVRAGFLKKELTLKTCNQCCYILIKNTGSAAPVIGRTWFLFDPNTGETWDDIPEREKINQQLTSKKNGLEDAGTSSQAQTAT